MNFDIHYSDIFKRGAKALAKKYPSLKQYLTDFIKELAEKPDMGDPLGNICIKLGCVLPVKAVDSLVAHG